MGFGTVFTTLTFLMVFAGMMLLVVTTQQTITASATEIREQTQALQQQTRADISITDTQLLTPQTLPWTTTYQDEFTQGTFENTTTQGDSVVLSGGQGTYTSRVYNTGHTANYTQLTWTAIIPPEGTLSFHIRTANTLEDLQTAPFVGPDGTTSTQYTTSGTTIHANNQEQQYIQWRATLQTTDQTPQLISATIGVRRDTPHVRIELENTGQTKLRFEDTTLYTNGVRQPRTDAARVIQQTPFMDERLWNPGQLITLYTFELGIINVHNQRAQATTTA